jgi:phage tail tape-measure protein
VTRDAGPGARRPVTRRQPASPRQPPSPQQPERNPAEATTVIWDPNRVRVAWQSSKLRQRDGRVPSFLREAVPAAGLFDSGFTIAGLSAVGRERAADLEAEP